MNCDDAFDALTNPSGLHAAQLDAHLANCPRCRDLQKVLEPALSLLCGELPEERVPLAASQSPFVSSETIRLAESTAAHLESMNRPDATYSLGSLTGNRGMLWLRRRKIRRAVGLAVRSAALILFGGLAVYFIGPWDRGADLPLAPSATPLVLPGQPCTRNKFPSEQKGTYDAGRVVLSCVACHLNARPPRSDAAPSSIRWRIPSSRLWAAASSVCVRCDENRDLLSDLELIAEITRQVS